MEDDSIKENWEVEDFHLTKKIDSLHIKLFKDFTRNNPIDDSQRHSDTNRDGISLFDKDSSPKPKTVKVNENSFLRQTTRKFKEVNSEQRTNRDHIKQRKTFFKLMLILVFVTKFIRKMRENTFTHSIKWLEKSHFKIINDLSFFKEGLEIKIPFRHNMSRLHRRIVLITQRFWSQKFCNHVSSFILKKLEIYIHPTNTLLLFWEFFVTLITILYFIVIPIRIGFNDYLQIIDETLKNGTIFFFFLDIAVNFNIAFYSKGQLIVSKKKIFMSYFYDRFFSDLFSISFLILTDFLGYSEENYVIKVFGLIYLLRLKNLSRAISRFEEFCFCDENMSNVISFVRLLINILLFSHWAACLWKLLGTYDPEHGWLAAYNIDTQNGFHQYIYSLYYVVVVINTVGFGDIVSQTIIEKIFTIFFIYTACVMFAYTINRIGMIVQNINKNEKDFKKTMNAINGYMNFKNIGFELKIKIRNYLEYIWQAEKMQNLNETQEIINRLSKSLKEELLLNANEFTLKKLPVFYKNFSEGSLRKMVCEMIEVNLTPEDIVYHENQLYDENLYIIRDGEVELKIQSPKNNRPTTIRILKKGDYFGELSFFTGIPRSTSAKSISFSSLFVLKKETFFRIIKENNEDFEKFCEIRDQMILYNNFSGIFHHCPSCDKVNHTMINCPFFHLTLSCERFFEKYNYSVPQQRTKSERMRKIKRGCALKNLKEKHFKAKLLTDALKDLSPNHLGSTNTLITIQDDYFDKETNKEEEEDEMNNLKASFENFTACELNIEEHSKISDREKKQIGSERTIKANLSSAMLRNNQPVKPRKLSLIIDDKEKFLHKQVTDFSPEIRLTKPNEILLKQMSIRNEEFSPKHQSSDNPPKLTNNEELSPNIRKNSHRNSFDPSKHWWVQIDNSSINIDCVKNFDNYFPSKNIENLIEVMNKIAFKNQKKLRSFFAFQDIWTGEGLKKDLGRSIKKSTFLFPKKKMSILAIKKKLGFSGSKKKLKKNLLSESFWSRVINKIVSFF